MVEGQFDDIDAMAASPLAWKQEYEQIGRGRFHGELTQVLVDRLQLGRVAWSPGVLQRGSAPAGTWVFGLPLVEEGSLHIRRRPAPPGEMSRRARALAGLLATLTAQPNDFFAGRGLSQLEAQIFDVILDLIPSAEVIEPLHSADLFDHLVRPQEERF